MNSFALNGQLFPDLGVASAQWVVTNAGEDELRVTLNRNMAADLPFNPYEKITLTQNGTQRFVGWFDKPASLAEAKKQQVTLTVSGPWRWLDRTIFSQTWLDMSTVPPTLTAAPIQAPVLNQGVNAQGVRVKLPIASVVKAALDAVIAKFGGVISYNSAEVAALGLEIPWSEKQNINCGSVIRDQLGWLPDRAVWWDYSQSVPTLRITQWDATATRQVTALGIDATRILLTPRFDLLARRVKITYIRLFAAGVNNQEARELVVDDSGAVGGTLAAAGGTDVELTFPLQKGEPPPGMVATSGGWVQQSPTIAQTYAAAISRLAVETEFSVMSDSLFPTWVPGETWGFSGIASQWATHTGMAQKITRDLFSGAVSVSIGPASHLGVQHLIDLARKNTPQAGGLGGGGGLPSSLGTLNVQIHVSSGMPADLAAALDNLTVTATGPDGSHTQDVPDGGLQTFNNLPAGSYSLSVAAGPGWQLDPDVDQDSEVSLASGQTKTAALWLVRVHKYSVESNAGDGITLDATGDPLVKLFNADSSNYLAASVQDSDSGSLTSLWGFTDAGGNNFRLRSDGALDQSLLEVFNADASNYVGISQTDNGTTSTAQLQGYTDNGTNKFVLKADGTSNLTKLTMQDSVGVSTLGTDELDLADAEGNTATISCSSWVLTDTATGNSVTIEVPDQGSVAFREMDYCDSSGTKKIKVLCTEPYA